MVSSIRWNTGGLVIVGNGVVSSDGTSWDIEAPTFGNSSVEITEPRATNADEPQNETKSKKQLRRFWRRALFSDGEPCDRPDLGVIYPHF